MSAVPKLTSRSVATAKGRQPAKGAVEVLSVIDRMALDPNISTDRLEMMIRREVDGRSETAKRAYFAAMTALQPELPVIAEHGKIIAHDGTTKSTYAYWEDIAEAIRPVLAAHGFNLTFRSDADSREIMITAVCAHEGGHVQEATVPMRIDLTDGKNDNQGIRSATSYGKRAAATLLLNITTRGEDDDGQKSATQVGEPRITAAQVQEIRSVLLASGRKEIRFLPMIGVLTLEDVPASRFVETLAAARAAGNAVPAGGRR